MRAPTPRRTTALVAALLSLLLTGCSGLPVDGPVEEGQGEAPTGSAAPFDYDPPGPQRGATRREVVAGFLSALQATPVSTRPAADFLSAEAAASWEPDRRTVVYGTQSISSSGSRIEVRLARSFELDRRGAWVRGQAGGRAGSGRPEVLSLELVLEDGEWRIADPPDAMVIPQSHFVSRYREYSLYFFDPTGSVLVPEPVYLPWGVQAPTLLVRGLLAGPPDAGGTVERTFFPDSTRLGVSVPVRDDGVAEVPLNDGVRDLDPEQLDLALAQLAWTLRQVPEVSSFQITVDGTQMDLPGGSDVVEVGGWGEFSPAIASASADLFGLRDDTVIQLSGADEITVAQLEAAGIPDARSLGVDMASQRFAVVWDGGSEVSTVTRSAEDATPVTGAYSGTDVLRPMWDRTDRLWLVDRAAGGAEVVVVHEGRSRRLAAPGLDGTEVLAATLSRDGTRLAAAVVGPGSETRLVVLRVVRRGAGAPVRLTQAEPLPTAEPLREVRELGWRDPTTVAVLTRPNATTSRVVLVACDGSSRLASFDGAVDVLFDTGLGLAASPGEPTALVVGTRSGRLHALDLQGRWEFDTVEAGIRAPAFVG